MNEQHSLVNWQNPYNSSGQWYKGNLHCHTASSSPCGIISQEQLLAIYKEQNFDFVSISDHLVFNDYEESGITSLKGIEWNSRIGAMPNESVSHQDHIGIYSLDKTIFADCIKAKTLSQLIKTTNSSCLTIANHPDWEIEHHSFQQLSQLTPHLDGIEIYNAGIISNAGQSDVTASVWDRLLSHNHRLLGFASDDAHELKEVGKAYIMVKSQSSQAEDIFSAIKRGHFYASNGAHITDIGRDNDEVFIKLPQEAQIQLIGDFNCVVATATGKELVWNWSEAPEEITYVRFRIVDKNWNQAWSQPFFKS